MVTKCTVTSKRSALGWGSAFGAFTLPNYVMFCNHRSLSTGGLVFYKKNEFHEKMVINLNMMLPQLETLFIELSYEGKTYTVGKK